jgi:hypothetical protein
VRLIIGNQAYRKIARSRRPSLPDALRQLDQMSMGGQPARRCFSLPDRHVRNTHCPHFEARLIDAQFM